jgi:RNA-binding protein YlmH
MVLHKLDQADHKDQLEILDHKDHKVQSAQLDHRDQLEILVQQVPLAHKDLRVTLVQLAHKDQLEILDHRDHKGQLAQLDHRDQLVISDLLAHQDQAAQVLIKLLILPAMCYSTA